MPVGPRGTRFQKMASFKNDDAFISNITIQSFCPSVRPHFFISRTAYRTDFAFSQKQSIFKAHLQQIKIGPPPSLT